MSGKSTRTIAATLGGCLGGAVITSVCITITLVLYWQREFLFGLEPSVTPMTATITTIIATNTPIPPTKTPLPTLTVTPHPATVFGDPILAEIAKRPPDYQDDFSNSSSGWDTGRQNDDVFIGTRNYIDGRYVIVADAASPDQMKKYGYGYAMGVNHKLVSGLKDYVFEVEQTWIQGSGWTMINLYDADNYAYNIRLSRPYKHGGFWLESPLQGPDTAVQFTNDLFFPFNAIQKNQVRITFIIKGQYFAIFGDGQPVYYSTLAGQPKLSLDTIEFRLLTDSSTKPLEIQWDNLKIWDLRHE